MEELEKGDILKSDNSDFHLVVTGVLEEMIFTRKHNDDGSTGPYEGPHDPEDLYTYGFKKVLLS